ncbi:MAG TPA: adenylosuccinate lyase [Bacilli bacterium]|nr:adenylosuccinate lyase [Bacilli bacterium]
MLEELMVISPLDGRYSKYTKDISNYFSEYAYIKYRVFVEIKWFLYLTKLLDKKITKKEEIIILDIYNNFNLESAKRVKEIEEITKHDVKAIEYYLKEKFEEYNLSYSELIHFACTSEDINNVAYSLMIREYLNKYNMLITNLMNKLRDLNEEYRDIPMLSHTHGQPATPTTLGKEFKIYEYRINNILELIKKSKLTSKFSGAVGNFNAHYVAYPEIDWFNNCKEFIESLGITFNPLTTQIESHDNICILFSYIKVLNNIINDLNNDMWTYISMNYLKLKTIKNEVGSSVMPHKVNPINFENSMANTKMSNGIFDVLISNLSLSKMQRDLSDSSLLRNIGVGFAHSVVAINQTLIGLDKISANVEVLNKDLANNPEVLAEAIQTVLRKNGCKNAYEILKEMTRGKETTIESLRDYIKKLDINKNDKERLLKLEVKDYIGIANKLNY